MFAPRLLLDALLLVCLLLAGVGATLAAALGSAPGDGAPVLVIAPPWSEGAGAMIAQAGGRAIGPDAASFGALAVFDGAAPVAQLRAFGAWAVRDARAMASLCGGRS
ncbi:hypothetical protein KUV62_17700 [Salipiger bermudensis]|uniref:hypothetical protein n=1 Tax=Salipiger bermudensis TaxID=344736 RepID=UPI001C9A244D|nr:hypothetical protein [Salipiger bermudensis]MBY6005760.1 hypothetical protein [Salipiger bermudensis]